MNKHFQGLWEFKKNQDDYFRKISNESALNHCNATQQGRDFLDDNKLIPYYYIKLIIFKDP